MTIGSIAQVALQDSSKALERAAVDVTRAAASDQVELSDAAVKLLQARTQYEASLSLARTADEIARHSIDLIA